MLRAVTSTLVDALVNGDELHVDALGRLWIEEKSARRVVSNLAGQRRVYGVRNRRVVRFRASRRLVAAVNNQHTGEEPEIVRERKLEMARKSRDREEIE